MCYSASKPTGSHRAAPPFLNPPAYIRGSPRRSPMEKGGHAGGRGIGVEDCRAATDGAGMIPHRRPSRAASMSRHGPPGVGIAQAGHVAATMPPPRWDRWKGVQSRQQAHRKPQSRPGLAMTCGRTAPPASLHGSAGIYRERVSLMRFTIPFTISNGDGSGKLALYRGNTVGHLLAVDFSNISAMIP